MNGRFPTCPVSVPFGRKGLTSAPPSRLGIPIRITKYRANCLKCGTELAIYPRHIEHHEPIVCPSCGRRNSADEFDLRDQIRDEQARLGDLIGKKN